MHPRLLQLSLTLMLALGVAGGAHAQSKPRTPAQGDNSAVLPVLNNASGKVEAYLLLEPTGPAQLPMGQLAATSKTLVDSKQLSVQPVLASH